MRPRPVRSGVSPALQQGRTDAERSTVIRVQDNGRLPILIELDLTADVDTETTRQRFRQLLQDVVIKRSRRPGPVDIADSYVKCLLTADELETLWEADRSARDGHKPTIFRVWPDYTIDAHLDKSVSTIKSDAAGRTYAALELQLAGLPPGSTLLAGRGPARASSGRSSTAASTAPIPTSPGARSTTAPEDGRRTSPIWWTR